MRKITLESLTRTRIDRCAQSSWAVLESTVMLVDPQSIFLDILASGFQKRGFTNVVSASQPSEALELMRQHPPKLIVVGFDAIESDTDLMLKTIQASGSFKSIPLLVITTTQQESLARGRFHLNIGSVFCKPIDMGRLIATAVDRIEDGTVRDSISAIARRSRVEPASEKYRRLRRIAGRG